MFSPLLPSCTPGQETPGFGWEPCIPQPEPTAWPASAKMSLWERGTSSLSLFLVLFFFIIFSALTLLSWDAGLGVGSPDPPFWGCCIPLEQIHIPQCLLGRADHHCQPPPHCSHCNSNWFLIKTPNPLILPAACCFVAGGTGFSMGTRR